MTLDERMMGLALEQAQYAASIGETPVGAVIARGEEVISIGYNRRETGKNALYHAEILAIDAACQKLGGWRLPGCTLYVTLEPCPMCAGAIIHARLPRVVYGAADAKAGSVDSVVSMFELPYNHRPKVTSGIRAEECGALLSEFFQKLRRKRAIQKMKKIDMHMHTSCYPAVKRLDGHRFASPQEMREIYDQIGVERGVVLPLSSPEWQMSPITSYDAAQVVAEHPETCGWWFCYVDPRSNYNTPGVDLGYFLRQYIERGCKGVGEVTCNLPFDAPEVLNLFHHAEALSLPLTFHIGQLGNDYGLIDEIGLPRLEKVLQMFPNLIFIGHSQKFWAEISGDLTEEARGGYPKGKVAPGGRVPELLRKYKNLHADLSAGSGHNAITRDPEFGYAFLEEFADQLHYGVDVCAPEDIRFPMMGLSKFLDDAYADGKISESAYRKISRENSLQLLERDLKA